MLSVVVAVKVFEFRDELWSKQLWLVAATGIFCRVKGVLVWVHETTLANGGDG